jgi:hypothetical protein
LKAERQAADIGYFQEAALSEVINPCSLIWFEVLLAPLADICVPLGGLQTAKASFPQSQPVAALRLKVIRFQATRG